MTGSILRFIRLIRRDHYPTALSHHRSKISMKSSSHASGLFAAITIAANKKTHLDYSQPFQMGQNKTHFSLAVATGCPARPCG